MGHFVAVTNTQAQLNDTVATVHGLQRVAVGALVVEPTLDRGVVAMDVKAVLGPLADGIHDLGEILTVVVYDQVVVAVVEAVLDLLGRILQIDDRSILIRRVELQFMPVGKGVRVLQVSRMADMYRIQEVVYRVGDEVQPMVLFTEALLRVLQALLAVAYRIIIAGEVVVLAAPEERIAQGNMALGGIHGQGIRIAHGPAYDAIASVGAIVVNILAVLRVVPRCNVHHGVVVDTRRLDHRVLWPEELHRVAFAEVVGGIFQLCLTWTNYDVVEVLVVAIPYDGIVGIFHTGPLAAPYVGKASILAVLEPRSDRITQHHRMLGYLVFASEGGVVLGQGRCDIEYEVDGRVTSASRGVGMRLRTMACVGPDRVRILATQDIRQVRLADGVGDGNVVGSADLDVDVEDRVARMLRIVRRYGYAVDESSVLHEGLVAPGHARLVATFQVDGRVVGQGDGQIEAVVLFDKAVLIDRVGP